VAEEYNARDQAIQRLKAKRGFQANVVTYVIVNLFLVFIWAITTRGYPWFLWVMGGWGLGLAMHAWTIYGSKPITEDEIQREMERGDNGVA
jgi:uncharacterized membrane protein YecN with MAPEG domain